MQLHDQGTPSLAIRCIQDMTASLPLSTLVGRHEGAEVNVCPSEVVPTLSGMADEFEFIPTSPKSLQIANEIEKRIKSGEYPPNHPIYEVRLVQEFGVARETARKASRILRDRGLIFTVRGMGSFVASPDTWQSPE